MKKSFLAKKGNKEDKMKRHFKSSHDEVPRKKKKKVHVKRGHHSHTTKDKTKGKDKPPARHKGKSNSSKPGEITNYIQALSQNQFLTESLEAVTKSGLDIGTSISVSNLPPGGRISACRNAWHHITNDAWVLDIIARGYKVQFIQTPNTPIRLPNPPTTTEGADILTTEVHSMLAKGAIREVKSSDDEVVSPFFARPKASSPGKWRPIISMKKVNECIRKVSFKMVTVKDIRLWVREGHFFTSLDLSDAYFSIPLHHSVWRFTRFVWNDLTYEFMVNMFGLGPSARLFTKVLAPVVRFLRRAFDMLIQGYIDDFLIQAITSLLCLIQTHIAIIIFHVLGFEVNFVKSSLIPSQTISHLGFEWDSISMTISLPQKKVEKIVSLSSTFLKDGRCTANQLRSFLGTVESTRPAVSLAALHYRNLQAQMPSMKFWRGAKVIAFSQGAKEDLSWWRDHLAFNIVAPLRGRSITLEIATDASGTWGWGGHSIRTFAQGPWNPTELDWHINLKEMIAAHRCLEIMMCHGDHVHLTMDSKTAVAFINRQGGTRSRILSQTAINLWKLVLTKKGWVKATWLPRESNTMADMLSKANISIWDFGIREELLQPLWNLWFKPLVDCFASRRFHITQRYYSFHPDQMAERRDAFSVNKWPSHVYAFPPVPLIPMMLDKIRSDKIRVIAILPKWENAKWWDMMSELLVTPHINLGDYRAALIPLAGQQLPRLGTLIACLLQG